MSYFEHEIGANGSSGRCDPQDVSDSKYEIGAKAHLVVVILCLQWVSDFEHEIGAHGSPRHRDSASSESE